MFVRSYTELPIPFADVEAALLRSPAAWIPGLAARAEAWGAHLLTEVGFGSGVTGVHKEVQIDVGRPSRAPGKTIVPMRWHATTSEHLFPVMEADLELAAIGPNVTQLSMDGRYTPPFGGLGRVADRTLMHRVAEATVRDFVSRAARRLTRVVERSRVPAEV